MKKIITIFAIFASTVAFSQVGIGTQTPSLKSILDLTSTDKGFLLPRLTTTERIAISPNATSEKGMQVFDTSTNSIWFWNGSIWTDTGAGDKTNDAFVNNATNKRVELGTNSDGTTARTAGTEFVIKDKGNTGIGTSSPDAYAKLDVSSTNQGFLVPRINLTSTTLDLNADGDSSVANQPIGLLIFNTGTTLANGFYFWNGAEWRTVDNSTAIAPSISNVLCSGAILNPSTYTSGPYSGTLTVPYENGNGGTYSGGTFTTSNGLIFTLQAGKLEYGSGNLVFKVTGNATLGSPNTSNITINNALVPFISTGGFSCTTNDIGIANVSVKSVAVMGGLINTNATYPLPAASWGSTSLWTKEITTPDGKWSLRFINAIPYQLQYTDIQIRNNSATSKTIMWNMGDNTLESAGLTNASNALIIPAKVSDTDQNSWYGNNGANGDVAYNFATAFFPGWANQDVYYAAPEFRRYTWTTTDPTDKTIYTLTAFMGAATYTGTTAAAYQEAKCYLKIDEIKAN